MLYNSDVSQARRDVLLQQDWKLPSCPEAGWQVGDTGFVACVNCIIWTKTNPLQFLFSAASSLHYILLLLFAVSRDWTTRLLHTYSYRHRTYAVCLAFVALMCLCLYMKVCVTLNDTSSSTSHVTWRMLFLLATVRWFDHLKTRLMWWPLARVAWCVDRSALAWLSRVCRDDYERGQV